ncbi:MAG: hypothetical protein R8G66_19930 [Cytophagales bacterium]|nr:hypothetical protein [Cytophagales bacterium]
MFLVALIFFLISYILHDYGFNDGLVFVLCVFGMILSYASRFYNTGKKSITDGYLDKTLLITPNSIEIDGKTFNISDIDKLQFELQEYDNQTDYGSRMKSDGNSNRIIISTNNRKYGEYFRVGTRSHMAELHRVIAAIRESGTQVEVTDKYA